ncbi:MAG: Sua5/YciO/YrdC/YwlC family protein [Spirochaetes bacterium]|nr:Sua5/YciO/YrdC/YwlC family protein [Spirochaetota bacterium]
MMQFVESPYKNDDIIIVKKLKKDGSLDADIIHKVTEILHKNGIVVLPVDSQYEIVGIANPTVENKLRHIIKSKSKKFVRLIASFKMLESLATVTKFQYDFLHRIWPGEVTAIVPRKDNATQEIALRFPKTKFVQEIIEATGQPLFATNVLRMTKGSNKHTDIIRMLGKKVDAIVIIEELCKRHPRPTLISLFNGKLKILRAGKISSEEIQSYYYLGSCDEEI